MARPVRIVAGGIMHETNSFTPVPTRYEDFQRERGLGRYRDDDGSLALLEGIEVVPTFVAAAGPGGLVERGAYERLKAELTAELAAALPADGLLLDLHGAMEVDGIGDGETDLVGAVRDLVGGDMPIAVSLDLHANLSPAVVAAVDILTAYRTAPHRDGGATRQRALTLLAGARARGRRPAPAMVKLPLVLAGEAAVTDVEPARSLYASLPELAREAGLIDASLLIGCAWTDSPFATVSAVAVAESDAALAQRQAARLADMVWQQRDRFGYAVEALDVDGAVAAAMRPGRGPVYISDSGDNVTAGAPGDSPQLAARLVAAGAQGALVAGVCDPAAVAACAAAGVGATLRLSVGAALDARSGPPLVGEALVERVGASPEPAYAVVRMGGVRIILTADRRAFVERAQIAAAGLDPDAQQIIVVKLGYLFPDLAAHAGRAYMALSGGATTLRLDTLPYRRLPRPVYPLDAGATF